MISSSNSNVSKSKLLLFVTVLVCLCIFSSGVIKINNKHEKEVSSNDANYNQINKKGRYLTGLSNNIQLYDSNSILSCGDDKTARIWDVNKEKCLFIYEHPGFVNSVRYHPDDSCFATACYDKKIRVSIM